MLDDLERLRRRLAREQRARQEAELIAERELREAWLRQKEIAFLQSVARAANEMSSRAAMGHALAEVCAFTGWPVGHVHMVRRRGASLLLRSTRNWHGAAEPRFEAFRRISEAISFRTGEGLPGAVLESGQATWARDFDRKGCYPRAAHARQAGLRTGLAFPVLIRREVAAILEFFTHDQLEPNEQLLALMARAGEQLGRAIERDRAQRGLKAKNRELQALVIEAQEQRQAAEAASRAKSAFLAVTSHEVRTPLNAVLGLAEGLRREPLSEGQASLVDGIVDAGAMLMRLLNAVLDLSKIESGGVVLNEHPFDLHNTLAVIERVWRPKAENLGLSLAIQPAHVDGPLWVRADGGKLEQSLINLVSNAIKFTPRGGRVQVTCTAEPGRSGTSIAIVVEDSGPGVPAADRTRILLPYEQTATGRDAGGAGLGLSICVGNMSAMGGTIAVSESALGGAAFTLAFPVAPAQAEAPRAPVSMAASQSRTLRVLAAEDNEVNRRVLQVLLSPLDLELAFAEDGRQALDALDVAAFDVVLMDANMPVMDGVQALEAIRARKMRIPVYMLTANALDEDVRRYLAAGADGVVAKPIDLKALYAVLSEVGGSPGEGAASLAV